MRSPARPSLHVVPLRAIAHAVALICATTCAIATPALAAAPASASAAALAIPAASDDLSGAHVVQVTAAREGEQQVAVGLGARALPSSVTEITAEELATLNVGRDISNVFRRVPGVVANNIDQGDTGNGFRMRGFATQGTHGADTAVHVDGVPQNIPSSQGGGGHGPVFLEWLTPDMIGSIAVIKGPVSALFGDQNRAGAVDIVTADGGASVPSSATLMMESYGGRRGTLVLAGEYNQVRSLLVADRYTMDGFRHASHNRRNNLFWKLSTDIGDGVYSLRASYYDSDYAGAGYLSLPALENGLDPHAVQFDLPGFGEARRKTLVFNRRPLAGDAGWFATMYAEDFERSRAIPNSVTAHTYGYDDRDIYGARFGNTWTSGQTASLTLGAETRKDRGEAFRQQYQRTRPTANYVNNQHLDLLTHGLFAQGQYRIVPALKLHAGVRIDRFDYTLLNRKLPAASTDYKGEAVTPKFGAVWSAAPGLDVFVNVAQGLRSPAAEQISSSGALGPLGARGGKINDTIDPSKVRSHDLGVNARIGQAWKLSGAFYTIENDDEIINSAPDVFTASGQTTRRGLELDVHYEASRAFSAYLSYGRILRAQLDNPAPGTGALLSVPAHTWKGGAQYRRALGAGTLSLNGDVYVTARNPYYMGTPSRQRDMPTFVRYDLKASYDIGNLQATLFATVQPHEFASDIAYGTATGLLLATVAQTQGGASLRYFF